MRKPPLNLLLVPILLAALGLACNLKTDGEPTENAVLVENGDSAENVEKIEGYEIREQKFAFYKIPAGLDQEDLIETARKIHKSEKETQLILVDDETGVADYIDYVKAYSEGKTDKELPKDWADAHIIANVQGYINGRWVLCKGYGFEEIADLK